MTERPMIFSGGMVRAILDGQKTQTRRVLSYSERHGHPHSRIQFACDEYITTTDKLSLSTKCPYRCDRLWVREGLIKPDGDPWLYAADRQPVMVAKEDESAMIVWAHHKAVNHCPSIHMPRWAARLALSVSGISVQRLQDLSEADAIAEGVSTLPGFVFLWDSLNIKRPGCAWADNPWVWRVEFSIS